MTRWVYQAGSRPTRSESAKASFSRFVDVLMDQGPWALQQMQRPTNRQSAEVRALFDAGYLQEKEEGVDLTPNAVHRAEETMLAELFRAAGFNPTLAGRHERGGVSNVEAGDELRPYEPGEPLDHVDIAATLANALQRGLPLALRDGDVMRRPERSNQRCATVLLLDQSGSMAWHGKFALARRAVLALRALIRHRFPEDEILTAGFASRAEALPGSKLMLATPRDVGLFDTQQREHRIAASADPKDVPGHFTNIQAGLRLARRWLRGKVYAARQVMLITDGEPTAHLEGNELVLRYPAGDATRQHTLQEAQQSAREGITVSVFGLFSEWDEMTESALLRQFIERLAKVGRGAAICCPRQLSTNLFKGYFGFRSRLAPG